MDPMSQALYLNALILPSTDLIHVPVSEIKHIYLNTSQKTTKTKQDNFTNIYWVKNINNTILKKIQFLKRNIIINIYWSIKFYFYQHSALTFISKKKKKPFIFSFSQNKTFFLEHTKTDLQTAETA